MEIQMKVISALTYGFVSLFITLSLKAVLSIYKFPSVTFIGICQIASILILSLFLKLFYNQELGLNKSNLLKIYPLPVFYVIDILMGLGGTMELNLPMFTVLRRISNVMLLFAEYFYLKSHYSNMSIASIFLMLLGSIIAALNDLSFSWIGYTFVMINNISTVTGGIYLKLKQKNVVLNDLEIVFYNAVVSFVPLSALLIVRSEIRPVITFEQWANVPFVILFVGSCILGALLKFSMVFCTQHNGPLTTSIIGVTKNIVVTYVGMNFDGSYIFNWYNFFGLNISMVGAVLYISKNFPFQNCYGKNRGILKM